MWFPIPDLHAPEPARAAALVDELVRRVGAGETLIVHCGAGMGRAGTIAVCVLNRLGVAVDDALATISTARPGAGPEVGAQRSLVEQLAERVRSDGDAD